MPGGEIGLTLSPTLTSPQLGLLRDLLGLMLSLSCVLSWRWQGLLGLLQQGQPESIPEGLRRKLVGHAGGGGAVAL